MRNKKEKPASGTRTKNDPIPAPHEGLILPVGVKFCDIYMDASQVATELNYGKRSVRNMRLNGAISFTTLHGKLFYFRQEIASILHANKVPKKNKGG